MWNYCNFIRVPLSKKKHFFTELDEMINLV
jgi:hypothetical protein